LGSQTAPVYPPQPICQADKCEIEASGTRRGKAAAKDEESSHFLYLSFFADFAPLRLK
jgi:hypothetical protein